MERDDPNQSARRMLTAKGQLRSADAELSRDAGPDVNASYGEGSLANFPDLGVPAGEALRHLNSPWRACIVLELFPSDSAIAQHPAFVQRLGDRLANRASISYLDEDRFVVSFGVLDPGPESQQLVLAALEGCVGLVQDRLRSVICADIEQVDADKWTQFE